VIGFMTQLEKSQTPTRNSTTIAWLSGS